MKASKIIEKLCEYGEGRDYSKSCDTCKTGSLDTEVNKIAVSMFATIGVVKAAKEWGAKLLIIHEPTYYSHMDVHTNDKIECEKRKFIEDSGLALFRFHDHPHYSFPDLICKGVVSSLDISGEVEYVKDSFDLVRITLDSPMTPVEFTKAVEERLKIKHIRICGNRDLPCRKISLMCGTPPAVFSELKSDECEILMTGEACEWMLGEYARDASDLGHKKTLLIMGHIGSERAGMEYVAEILSETFPEIETKYFECGEVCSYTD